MEVLKADVRVCHIGPNRSVRDMPNRPGGEPRRFRHAKRYMPLLERKREEREIEREGGRKKKKEGDPPEALRRTAVAVGRRNGLPRLRTGNRGGSSLFLGFFFF